MITKSEVAKLLGLAAVYDQRTVGETDVEGWHAVAEVSGWSFPAVRRVIVEHYSRDAGRPRLDPATVTDRIRRLRSAAAETFEAPRIPDSVSNADYPAWFRRQRDEHVDAQLERWAATGEDPAAPPAVGNRSLPELIANAPDHVRAELELGARKFGRRP